MMGSLGQQVVLLALRAPFLRVASSTARRSCSPHSPEAKPRLEEGAAAWASWETLHTPSCGRSKAGPWGHKAEPQRGWRPDSLSGGRAPQGREILRLPAALLWEMAPWPSRLGDTAEAGDPAEAAKKAACLGPSGGRCKRASGARHGCWKSTNG